MFENQTLLKKDGEKFEEVDAATVVNSCDVLLVYFSAHWCPPCRGFTPVLKDFYEDVKERNVCIIFASSDRDENAMKDYFKSHGDYYAIPYTNQNLIQALKAKCQVNGIPKLCYLKDGEVKHSEVRALVTNQSPDAVLSTLKDIK